MKIVEFATKYNICFVTNGWRGELGERCLSFFGSELNDLKDRRRFEIFYGQYPSNVLDNKENYQYWKLFYGKEVFVHLLKSSYFMNNFDYIVYFDEDLFLYDWDTFIKAFEDFDLDSDYSVMAPPDGGIVCHRMRCAETMPNTFLCVFKCKKLRNLKFDEPEMEKYKTQEWFHKTEWYNEHLVRANRLRIEVENSRRGKELLYVELVKNHVLDSFPYEKKLVIHDKDIPYVMLDSEDTRFDGLSKDNYNHIDTEPYYVLFYYLIANGAKIKYLFVTDLYKDEYNNVVDDYGGVASELYFQGKPFAVHTWLSRIYIDCPAFKDNYERINKIYNYAKKKQDGLNLLR